MKAVVYHGIGDILLEDIPRPVLENPEDVIIKVALSSICASDIHIKEEGLHTPGKVIGHEYCGIVEEVGSEVHHIAIGDRVVGKPFAHCGYCFYCLKGQPELCQNGILFGVQGGHGVQAEYARIPYAENTLFKIPDALTFEDMIFVGDIIQTGLTGIIRGRMSYAESVGIFGSGPVGLCAVALAGIFGASKVIAVDILDYRLDIARQFGALTVNAAQEDVAAEVKKLTGGIGVDLGIEAAGLEVTFNSCLRSIRRGGKMSILGLFTKPTYFNISERFFDVFNLSIGLGDSSHMEEVTRLIEAGRLNVKPLITHKLPLSDAIKGYEIFEKKLENCLKVLLEP